MNLFCTATLQIEYEVRQTPEDVLSEEDELVGSFAVIALLKVDVLRRWRDHNSVAGFEDKFLGQLKVGRSCPIAVAVTLPDLVAVSPSIDAHDAPSAMAVDWRRLLRHDDALGENQSAVVDINRLQSSLFLAVVFSALGFNNLIAVSD
jgi:hypothetical protein